MYLASRFFLWITRTPVALPGCRPMRAASREEFGMARYEFRFIVTDTELSEEHQQKVGQAVAEAGALALAALTPKDAVTVRYGRNLWWRGIPPPEIIQALEGVAAQKAGEGAAGEIR
jgi:hypothetical protein